MSGVCVSMLALHIRNRLDGPSGFARSFTPHPGRSLRPFGRPKRQTATPFALHPLQGTRPWRPVEAEGVQLAKGGAHPGCTRRGARRGEGGPRDGPLPLAEQPLGPLRGVVPSPWPDAPKQREALQAATRGEGEGANTQESPWNRPWPADSRTDLMLIRELSPSSSCGAFLPRRLPGGAATAIFRLRAKED